MTKHIRDIVTQHGRHWSERSFIQSVTLGMVFFAVSMVFNHLASLYATEHASSAVKDLILDNVPVFNVDFIVNEGAVIFASYICILVLLKPQRIPFFLKSIALFIFIRSIFIMFTHLGPFPDHSYLDQSDAIGRLTAGGDYFFSGHTGLPFLMALVFWKNRTIRITCLLASIFFGASVLLGHLHYSIDVFAAFFITHSIYVLARHLFQNDADLLDQERVSRKSIGC